MRDCLKCGLASYSERRGPRDIYLEFISKSSPSLVYPPIKVPPPALTYFTSWSISLCCLESAPLNPWLPKLFGNEFPFSKLDSALDRLLLAILLKEEGTALLVLLIALIII